MVRAFFWGLFLCCAIAGRAQESYFNKSDFDRKLFFGSVLLGMNAAQIDGDTYAGFKKAGLNIGLGVYTRFGGKCLGNIELLYSQKGAREINLAQSPSLGTVPLGYRAALQYVEIPLSLNYLVYDKLYLGAGLSYARLIGDKEEMDSYTTLQTVSSENTFRQQDLNYLVSLQYQLYENILVRVRYQYSALNIRDAAHIPSRFASRAQYNNLFAFHLICVF